MTNILNFINEENEFEENLEISEIDRIMHQLEIGEMEVEEIEFEGSENWWTEEEDY